MRFHCPKCPRDEEIINDRKPLCATCAVEMLPASDYSEFWMSPWTAIIRMKTISETYGNERAGTERKFQGEREAWATGILGMALSTLRGGEEFWVEIETRENTPDTKLHHIDQSTRGNIDQTWSIEVVDWEDHVEDIMEVIEKKCSRAYPSDFTLVVSARHKELNPSTIIEAMQKIRSPFFEIWVVGVLTPNHMVALRIRPPGSIVNLGLPEIEKARNQGAFIKRGIRGMKSGFYDLGSVFLPIP